VPAAQALLLKYTTPRAIAPQSEKQRFRRLASSGIAT
jgi:hypothetical protein